MCRTPWGESQLTTHYDTGIVFYSTASHGGFKLDRARNAQVPNYLRRAGGWYEEDCDWAIVALIFPIAILKHDGEKTPNTLDSARKSLLNWHPEYERFYGVELQPGESFIRDQRQFALDHANDWVGISAVGDWHASTPKGMVHVTASLGGDRTPPCQCRYFLVPADEYKTRPPCGGFVVDPTRHREVARA